MTEPSQAPGAPTDAGDGGQAPTEPQQPGTEPQDITSLPEWAQNLIAKGRSKEADYRTKYQASQQTAQAAAEQRDKVLDALGLKPDGTDAPDPEALGAQLNDIRARAWETAVENKILRLAPKLGVDADGLLDSVAFLDSLADAEIDPDGTDFAQQLEAHVTGFITHHPKFKTAQQGAPRGGGDFGGGPNLPPASLDSQIAEAEKRRDFATVIQLKRQKAAQT
jgi:hypothetical protein